MLYEHNSSIEPTSSTLLLQRTPSESGSYTTDEYSYRRTNGGSKQQLKTQTTIERNKKKSKKSNYTNGGTLCSKSSTASSHISDNSKVSTVQQQLPNKSNMFLLNELPSGSLQPVLPQSNPHDQDSPPSPAPNPFHPNSSQRIFTTNNNNYNTYEPAYETNLYGGLNRVQLGNRHHQTLNTRQLTSQQRKHQQRPAHNRVLDFIELNNELNGSTNGTMNLISNPLHHNSLQGSLPSLVVNNGQETNAQQQTANAQSSIMKKMLINNKQLTNRAQHQMRTESNLNSSLNRSSSSLVSESDNFYCDIEEAHRVQSDFRAKLNANQKLNNKAAHNRYLNNGEPPNYADSGDENGDLVSENDKLISRDENKLIVRHRRTQGDEDEEDDLLADQYSDYECIDRIQPTNSATANRFTSLTNAANGYLRQSNQPNKPTFNNNFNTSAYNPRLTPVNLMNNPSSASSLNESRPFNLSLARKNQLESNKFSNSQPGLFRFKDPSNGTFNTMQSNLNNRMR